MHRIFVYGTLKRGCKNHRHLAGQTYIGEARTAPGFRLYDLGDYPGMVAVPDDHDGVTGELWDVDDATLAHLDDFEGVPEGLYQRINAPIATVPGCAAAYAYVYARNIDGRPRLGPTWTE